MHLTAQSSNRSEGMDCVSREDGERSVLVSPPACVSDLVRARAELVLLRPLAYPARPESGENTS